MDFEILCSICSRDGKTRSDEEESMFFHFSAANGSNWLDYGLTELCASLECQFAFPLATQRNIGSGLVLQERAAGGFPRKEGRIGQKEQFYL